MKLSCWWAGRRLARQVLVGGTPTGHAAQCPVCRSEWAQLVGLAEALPKELPAVLPSASFEDRVWARICRPVERRDSRGVPVFASALVIVVLAGAAWLLVHAQPVPKTGGVPVVKHESTPLPVKQVVPRPAKQLRAAVPKPEVRHWHKVTKLAVKPKTHVADAALAKSVGWADIGAYYERAGLYGEASDAYALAYAEKQDPGLAYAAGCAAETAGDIGQAVTFYTELLDKSSEGDNSSG